MMTPMDPTEGKVTIRETAVGTVESTNTKAPDRKIPTTDMETAGRAN